MPIPAPLVDSKSLLQPALRPERLAFAPYLALTVLSGLVGALGDTGGTTLGGLGGPLAFSLSLALYSAARFAELAAGSRFAGGDTMPRLHVRRVSRQVYLLLYALFAAREIQSVLCPPAGALTHAQLMHGLWPYLLGALPALIIVRVLSARSPCAPHAASGPGAGPAARR